MTMWGLKEKLAGKLSWVFSDSSSSSYFSLRSAPEQASSHVNFDSDEYDMDNQYKRGLSKSHACPSTEQCFTHAETINSVHDQSSVSQKMHLPDLLEESSLLSDGLRVFVHEHLPVLVKGCEWVLLYSTKKHGISLLTLLRRSADLPGPCLLVTGDKHGAVFGGLLNAPLKPTPKAKYQGSNETFVFTTCYGDPRLFRPTGANRYYYMCTNDLLAFGGGGNFALRIEGDLLHGSSGPCETFGNSCLAHSSEFALKNVELWGFAHISKYL